ATGDPKDVDCILKSLAKDKLRGPSIALGEGLACTKEAIPAAAQHAAELAPKAKGDLRFALLEGAAELADPAAWPALQAFAEKVTPEEHSILDVAQGACGKEKAVAGLASDVKSLNPLVRFGAVEGLARSGSPLALPHLVDALHDIDPRVIGCAADALAK